MCYTANNQEVITPARAGVSTQEHNALLGSVGACTYKEDARQVLSGAIAKFLRVAARFRLSGVIFYGIFH
jgi:hypothetical protein